MARDYKNSGAKSKAKTRPIGSWVSFLSGLGIGLIIALGVYMWSSGLACNGNRNAHTANATDDADDSGVSFDEQMDRALPKREFEFYQELPKFTVKVPDLGIAKSGDERDRKFGEGSYVLQVGSFKAHADADRAKAQLALRGIQAKIHRKVVNGQDVWYRVLVGPYSDLGKIESLQAKLKESKHEFIVLKIDDQAD